MAIINPQADIGVGIAAILGGLFATRNLIAAGWDKLSSFLSRKDNPSPIPNNPDKEEDETCVHDVVDWLIHYFEQENDRQGLQLATGVGIHVYEQALVNMANNQPMKAKSEEQPATT